MKMYLITYRGKPTSKSPEAKQFGGGYINCWIKQRKFEKADAMARSGIADNNWKIETLEEAYQVTRKNYSNDDDGLEYFEQALIDEIVFVYYTYPKRKKRKRRII
jgi:hypothetical protein